MQRLVRTGFVAAVAAAVIAANAAQASADHWWGRDRVADVQQIRISMDPPPCGSAELSTPRQDVATDIVGLSVTHGRQAVVVRAHLRQLGAWRHRLMTFPLATDGRDFEISVSSWNRRVPRAELLTAPTTPEQSDCGIYTTVQTGIPCEDLRLQKVPTRDLVRLTVPRVCIGEPRWVRAGLQVQRNLDGGRARLDVWGSDGLSLSLDPIPLSPKLRYNVRD